MSKGFPNLNVRCSVEIVKIKKDLIIESLNLNGF